MTYRTIVVGTDGSESSFRAVDRAGAVAAQENAKLIVASAHMSTEEKGGWSKPPSPDRTLDAHAADTLGSEGGYKMHGSAPVYEILHAAEERAKAAGAPEVELRDVVGPPVDALIELTENVNADLVVVGSVGMHSVAGRILGSVPSTISRKVPVDILIVQTD